MRKIIAAIMAICMISAVVSGCSGNSGETENTKESNEKSTTSTVKIPAKDKETDENTEENTDESTEENEENQNAEEKPESNQNQQSQSTEGSNKEPDPTDPPYVEPEPTDPPVQGGTFTSSDAYFSYNGVTISIGTNIDSIVASIGEPNSKTEADSCFGNGKDIAYHYSSFTINTVPSNGVNVVNTVTVNSTPKGVSVGQSENAIVSAYGDSGKISDYLYSFTDGGTLNFYLSGGTITLIEYC